MSKYFPQARGDYPAECCNTMRCNTFRNPYVQYRHGDTARGTHPPRFNGGNRKLRQVSVGRH